MSKKILFNPHLITILIIPFLLLLQSCDVLTSNVNNRNLETSDHSEELQINELNIEFAKTLANAIADNAELRAYLKEEALKQFNKDYDILYHLVKDKQITKNSTFRDQLLQHISESDLENIESRVPLLTVFIPNLPNGFSAETWNTEKEIPVVAVRKVGSTDVPIFNSSGEDVSIPKSEIPNFPVLVVKLNERVTIHKPTANSSKSINGNDSQTLILPLQNGDFSFYFKDVSFNGIKQSTNYNKTKLTTKQ